MRNTLILAAVLVAVIFAFIVGRSVRDPSVPAEASPAVTADAPRDRVAEPNEDLSRADNPEVADANPAPATT